MGNGQYYDPGTGRFLTRGAQQDQSNPYTPWNSDPAGMLIAPLALLALVFGRKKTRTKFDQFIILFVIVLSVGLSVSACDVTTDQLNIETAVVQVGTSMAATATKGWYIAAEVKLTDAAGATVTATITVTPSDTPTPDNTSTATLESTCTETPEPTSTVPGGTGDYSWYYYGHRYYEILRDTPGWWHSYNGEEFSMKTFIAIIYNYEFMDYPFHSTEFKDYATEAFARRYWEAIHEYGTENGSFYYLGGREMVIRRVDNNAPGILESDYHMEVAIKEAEKIIDPPKKWKSIEENAPYDWGNPTFTWDVIYQYIPEFYYALKNGIKGPNNDQILYINIEGDFFIVTRGQNRNLCDNRSCVNPKYY